MKNEKGFTLVELIMAVAMMGMLASMAIANFQHLAAKSRQTEAKGELSAMFLAEQSFIAENDSYTQCLNQAGFSPGDTPYYSTGYTENPNNACGNGTQICDAYIFHPITECNSSAYWDGGTWLNTTWPEILTGNLPVINSGAVQTTAAAQSAIPPAWNCTKNTFLVGAMGSISSSPLYDMWQIDNNKVITNIQSGL